MAAMRIPAKTCQIIVQKLGINFREVTDILEVDLPVPGPREVIVKNKFLGINASDINFSAGRYFHDQQPPFPIGFEGLGTVVTAGPDTSIKVGQFVQYFKYGAFCEYIVLEEGQAVVVPSLDPAYLALMMSGLTASMALEKEANLKEGETALVTAAAGGTGQFAVQLAKLAGCHVIGTCSSDEKVNLLKAIGCDRVINYKKDHLEDVLATEYPNGVDVVFDLVGSDMIDAALKNIALFGRILVVGSTSDYNKKPEAKDFAELPDRAPEIPIPTTLLKKSASLRGFALVRYPSDDVPRHKKQLAKLYHEGKLKVTIDKGENAAKGPFQGLEQVADAIEYMYTKKSVGKLVVELTTPD